MMKWQPRKKVGDEEGLSRGRHPWGGLPRQPRAKRWGQAPVPVPFRVTPRAVAGGITNFSFSPGGCRAPPRPRRRGEGAGSAEGPGLGCASAALSARPGRSDWRSGRFLIWLLGWRSSRGLGQRWGRQ